MTARLIFIIILYTLKIILKGINNIRNQIKKTIFLTSMFISNLAFAKMHDFETTHLKSMAGTGVAGILMEEAAFLNPASLAFFNTASAFAQRDMLEIKDSKGNLIQKPKSTGFVVADGNASLSGSLSYVNQTEGAYERKRWGLTTSAPLSKESAFGVSIRKSEDKNTLTNSTVDYYQTVIGITHALSDKTSLGIVAYDAFNSKGDETNAYVGVQQAVFDYITAAFDLGGDYNSDEISKSLIYRGGLQVRVLNDFFLRFGAFNNKGREEKGNGMGLAWVQPRLAFEFALKNTKQSANIQKGTSDFKTKETSFSIALRF
jgi:hypothetical protein